MRSRSIKWDQQFACITQPHRPSLTLDTQNSKFLVERDGWQWSGISGWCAQDQWSEIRNLSPRHTLTPISCCRHSPLCNLDLNQIGTAGVRSLGDVLKINQVRFAIFIENAALYSSFAVDTHYSGATVQYDTWRRSGDVWLMRSRSIK